MTPLDALGPAKGEILVVEDTPASLALLSELLTGAGHTVRQAPDGELALWTLRLRPAELILLDIHMPGIDGFEVCRRLKADPRTAKTPVIFLSAANAVEEKVRGLALGAVDYITKPYQAEEVLARVQTHLTLAQLSRELESERALLEQRVTERTAELKAEREEMAHVLAALDLAGDGIVIVNAEGRITYANRAMIDTIGAKGVDDLLGLQSEQIGIAGVPIFDADEIEAARERVRRFSQWSGELSTVRPDQPQRGKLLTRLKELPDGGRVAVFTDVTEAHDRERERRRLERQLEQAGKLEALGQLAAGVAHDFNNLLGAILGFAQFLVDDSGEDSRERHYASRIIKAGQQAKSLIGQILSFSNRGETAFERIDLGALIDENIGILKALVSPTTTLNIQAEVENPVLAAQRCHITQVLLNLVINASEALLGKPGTVTIEVGTLDRAASPVQRLTSLSANEGPVQAWTDADGMHHVGVGSLQPDVAYLRLSVIDTGEGMSWASALTAFDPPLLT